MTYTELVTKIRNYTEVDSNVLTATIIDGFISDAEFRILRDVDSDNNRKYATSSVVITQKYFNTPADLLVIRSAQVFNTDGIIMLDDKFTIESLTLDLYYSKMDAVKENCQIVKDNFIMVEDYIYSNYFKESKFNDRAFNDFIST